MRTGHSIAHWVQNAMMRSKVLNWQVAGGGLDMVEQFGTRLTAAVSWYVIHDRGHSAEAGSKWPDMQANVAAG